MNAPIHSDPAGEGNKDFTGMPIVSSRVDHIPPIPSWDEIFTIQNNGIPQGTKNMFKIYFNPPTRKSVAPSTPQTGRTYTEGERDAFAVKVIQWITIEVSNGRLRNHSNGDFRQDSTGKHFNYSQVVQLYKEQNLKL